MEKRRYGRARCRGRQDGRFEEKQIDYLCEGQTPHRIGMLVASVDGSVRQIAPGISPTTFSAAVTPAGGRKGARLLCRKMPRISAPLIVSLLGWPASK
jgi:hypothetical protein